MWTIFKEFLSDFSTETTIHGLKYLRKDKSYISRIYWSISLLFALSASIWLAWKSWIRVMELPTRTVFKNSQAHVTQIPLPAITLCTDSDETVKMFAQEFIDDIMIPKKYSKELVMDAITHNSIKMPRYAVTATANRTHLVLLDDLLDINRMSIRQFVEHLTPPCDVLIKKCWLRGREYPCGRLFQRTHGRCCSFNIPRDGQKFKPEYPRSAGPSGGLSVVITGEYGTTRFVSHQSFFFPDLDQRSLYVRVGQQLYLGFKPFAVDSLDEIKELKEPARSCVFNDERSLRFFKEYSYNNCPIDTRMNFSMVLCGCIGYYYPAPERLVCNWTRTECLREHHFINRRFAVIDSSWNLTPEASAALRRKNQQFDGMKCMMNCDYRDYRLIDVHTSSFDALETDFTGFYSDVDVTNHGAVHVYFPSAHYVLQEELLVAGSVTWLCSLGGVFSLLLSCSFISVAELVYFIWTKVVAVDLSQKLVKIKNKMSRKRTPPDADYKKVRLTILGPRLINTNSVFYINDSLLNTLEKSGELYAKKPPGHHRPSLSS